MKRRDEKRLKEETNKRIWKREYKRGNDQMKTKNRGKVGTRKRDRRKRGNNKEVDR